MINYLKKMIHQCTRMVNAFVFKLKDVKISDDFKIKGRVKVYGRKNSIEIGKGFFANSGVRYNPIGKVNCIVLQTINDGKIKIGNSVGISNAIICAEEKVMIGDNTLIGGGTIITDTDCHSVIYSERIKNCGTKTKEVTIGKGVFIGTQSIILKGVTIGDYSVVGAGSVVSCNIPQNEIWGGNPARFLKKIPEE